MTLDEIEIATLLETARAKAAALDWASMVGGVYNEDFDAAIRAARNTLLARGADRELWEGRQKLEEARRLIHDAELIQI